MTYRLRRLRTWLIGRRCCLAYRCGRPKIPTPSQFCRLHTDTILYERGDSERDDWRAQVAARMDPLSDDRLAALGLEIEIGRSIGVWRRIR